MTFRFAVCHLGDHGTIPCNRELRRLRRESKSRQASLRVEEQGEHAEFEGLWSSWQICSVDSLLLCV